MVRREPSGQGLLWSEPPEPVALAGPLDVGTPPGFERDPRGFTMWQPWCYAVLHLGKRIENRPWKPWRSILGRWVALHAAARRNDVEEALVAQRLRALTGRALPPPAALPRGVVVGFVRFTGFVEQSDDPWFLGESYMGEKNYGWVIGEVRAVARPVKARGFNGFWPVPEADPKQPGVPVRERVIEAAREAGVAA